MFCFERRSCLSCLLTPGVLAAAACMLLAPTVAYARPGHLADGVAGSPVAGSADGSYRVAGKLGTAAKAGAVGARAARERNRKANDNEGEQEAAGSAPATAADAGDPALDAAGPFKVTIPGKSQDAVPVPAPAPPPAANGPEQPRSAVGTGIKPPRPATNPGPVRTLAERGQPAAPDAPSQPQAAVPSAAAPAPAREAEPSAPPARVEPVLPGTEAATADQLCFAGCYTPTGSRSARPPAVAPPRSDAAQAPSQGFECIAGCDGVGRSRPSAVAGEAPAASDNTRDGRITVLRGVSRSKVYGVGQ